MRHALVNAQNRVVNIIEAEEGFTLETEEFRVIPDAERWRWRSSPLAATALAHFTGLEKPPAVRRPLSPLFSYFHFHTCNSF